MNSIVFLENEVLNETAVIQGDRAKEILDRHELNAGITISASIYNGRRGSATVKSITNHEIVFSIDLSSDPLPRNQVELIVGISRPQTIKKVIHIATVMGLDKLHIVNTENAEKSYWQSKILQFENYKKEIILGLEQSMDSIPPQILIHRSINKFFDTYLCEMDKTEKTCKFIADTTSSNNKIHACDNQQVMLAIGPEAGWSPKELEMFQNASFYSISLGVRILRVETAAAVGLGRLLSIIVP